MTHADGGRAVSASQIGHPFSDYLYKELGARNVTFIDGPPGAMR
jgi:hypothetical protein